MQQRLWGSFDCAGKLLCSPFPLLWLQRHRSGPPYISTAAKAGPTKVGRLLLIFTNVLIFDQIISIRLSWGEYGPNRNMAGPFSPISATTSSNFLWQGALSHTTTKSPKWLPRWVQALNKDLIQSLDVWHVLEPLFFHKYNALGGNGSNKMYIGQGLNFSSLILIVPFAQSNDRIFNYSFAGIEKLRRSYEMKICCFIFSLFLHHFYRIFC